MKKLLILAMILALAGPVDAARYIKAGEVEKALGRVEVLHGEEVIGRRIRSGASLFVKDLLRTKRRSQAEVFFIDGTRIKVLESSRLKVLGIERGKGDNAIIHKGRVLFEVSFLKVKGEFRVRTTTSIIGVKGTKFFVHVLPDLTVIDVLEGSVEITPIAFPEIRIKIGAGKSAVVPFGGDIRVKKLSKKVLGRMRAGRFESLKAKAIEAISEGPLRITDFRARLEETNPTAFLRDVDVYTNPEVSPITQEELEKSVEAQPRYPCSSQPACYPYPY